MPNPKVIAQLQSQVGMGRMGGAASRGSTPVPNSTGRGFAAMENTLLKSMTPDVTKLAKTKGRHVKKTAAEKFGG